MNKKLWLRLKVKDLEKENYKVHLSGNVANESALYVLLKVAYMYSGNNSELIQDMLRQIKNEVEE